MSEEAASRRFTSFTKSWDVATSFAATSASPMDDALSPSSMVTSTDWPSGSSSTWGVQPRKRKKAPTASTITMSTATKMAGFGSRLGMMALVS